VLTAARLWEVSQDLTWVWFSRLLTDLGRELKPLATLQVALSWNNDLGAARFLSDSVTLKTILRNLIGNALKFTTAGSVHVAAEHSTDPEREDEVVFSVRDTGIGIAPEHLSVIFELFRQVDSSPGAGSTFTVTLPLRRTETDVADTEPTHAAQ
jgi:signal transduction histidine kinase